MESGFLDARQEKERSAFGGWNKVVGTQNELAARLGVRRQTIHYIRTGRHAMSYGMQVMLEGVVEGELGAGTHHGE